MLKLLCSPYQHRKGALKMAFSHIVVAPVGHVRGIVSCQVSVDQLEEVRLKSGSFE